MKNFVKATPVFAKSIAFLKRYKNLLCGYQLSWQEKLLKLEGFKVMGSVKTLLELGLGGFMGSKEALSPEVYSL